MFSNTQFARLGSPLCLNDIQFALSGLLMPRRRRNKLQGAGFRAAHSDRLTPVAAGNAQAQAIEPAGKDEVAEKYVNCKPAH